jgi:hypothetical protein
MPVDACSGLLLLARLLVMLALLAFLAADLRPRPLTRAHPTLLAAALAALRLLVLRLLARLIGLTRLLLLSHCYLHDAATCRKKGRCKRCASAGPAA